MKAILVATSLLSLGLMTAAQAQFNPRFGVPGIIDQTQPGIPPDTPGTATGPLQPTPTIPPPSTAMPSPANPPIPPGTTLCATSAGACLISAIAPPGLNCWCQSMTGPVPGTTQ